MPPGSAAVNHSALRVFNFQRHQLFGSPHALLARKHSNLVVLHFARLKRLPK